MAVEMSIGSKRTLRYFVRGEGASGVIPDLSADPVFFGFTPVGAGYPTSGLVAGSWSTFRNRQCAQIVVGPGGSYVPSAVGDLQVWLKVIDSPDVPLEAVGILTIKP